MSDAAIALVDTIRRYSEDLVPGDAEAADAAVGVALRCLVSGASMAEACEEARRFIGSWSRRPAIRHDLPVSLRAAS